MKRFSSRLRLLQWLDRRIGAPICGLLTLFRRATTWFGPRDELEAPGRILFVKLAEQGSTVLACDAIRRAIALVGRENVYFLMFEENRFILDLLGLVPPENVFAIRTTSARALIGSTLRQLSLIRRCEIDTCVDLEFFARASAIVSFLSGARTRVGFHSYFREGPYRGDLLTHRVIYNPHLHTSATFASLVQALDVAPTKLPTFETKLAPIGEPPRFRPDAEELARVRALLGAAGLRPGQSLVLLNANCGDLLPQRKWNDHNYVELARVLLAEFSGLAVVFTGSPEEAANVRSLVAQVASPRCISLAGATTLRELLVLYTLAEVLVTNDSGPAHFAALTEIEVVALFGPETPLLFAVPGPRSHPLWARLPCSPCVNAYNNRQTACRDNRCMQVLGIDLVASTVVEILRRRLVGTKTAASSSGVGR